MRHFNLSANVADGSNLYATAVLPAPPISDRALSVQERSNLIDQAYGEYLQLLKVGASIDPDEYCARFPACQTSLRQLIQARNNLDDDPDVLNGLGSIWPASGQDFLNFSLLSELGRGAFARVFLARERNVGGRLVAVKLSLHSTNEADTLGRIRHPSVVPVFSAQRDPETGFSVVVMPFMGGSTLCHVLDHLAVQKQRPIRAAALLEAARDPRWTAAADAPPDRVLVRGRFLDGVVHLGAQLAEGLATVHAEGFLHRDLKPSNVLLAPNGRPVLLDFNLALDQEVAEYRLGGTLPYMPPEHLRAMSRRRSKSPVPADVRVDLYGLGVLLYELLAGVHPFGPVPIKLKSNEVREFLLDRQQRGPRPLRDLNPETDPALDRLLNRCLAWECERRPASARELAAELRRLLSPPLRVCRWATRHARSLAAATVLAAVPATYGAYTVATMPSAAAHAAHDGDEHVRAGRFESAIAAYSASLKDDPHQSNVVGKRGQAYQKLGEVHYRAARWDDAVRAFTNAIEAEPQQARLYFQRGRAYQKAGLDAEAIGEFRRECLADDARAKACRGFSHSRLNDHSAAVKWYEEAIKGGFGTAIIHNDLAFSQLNRKRLDEAEASALKAIALDPGLRAAQYNPAVVWFKRVGADPKNIDPTPGLREFQLVIPNGPTSAEEYFHAAAFSGLALIHHGNAKTDGERAQATRYLQTAIEKGYPLTDIERCPIVRSAGLLADLPQGIEVKEPFAPPFQDRLVDPLFGSND